MNKLEEMRVKQKIDFKCKAVPGGGKTVIYLYGDIVDEIPTDWWNGEPVEGEYITPKVVRNLIEEVETNDVDIHINSYGGSVFASVAIHNYLKSIDKNIEIYIDGIAASGASVIAMAGSKIHMPKNTTLMIHRASSGEWGTASDMKKMAETLEKLDTTLLANYMSKFKGTEEELQALIEAETYFTAEEAFEYGLCDVIVEDKKQVEKVEENNFENKQDKKILYALAGIKF